MFPHQHTVVQLLPALLIIVHAAHVKLERALIGLNRNGHRLPANCLFQSNLIVLRHILIAIDCHHPGVLQVFLVTLAVLGCSTKQWGRRDTGRNILTYTHALGVEYAALA